MTDDELLRYSRHLLLDDIGVEGQEQLAKARVLVVGAGGLGSPVALYLASAGVGHLTIADGDHVELTNLQRQIAHDSSRLGVAKAASAARSALALNPGVAVVAVVERLAGERLEWLVGEHDVVVDCSDNFATRQAINAACVRRRRPLVSGAAIGFDGQIATFDHRLAGSPCYACVFPPTPAAVDVACSAMGVFAPLVGIIGSMQAAEALKLMLGIGTSLAGRLLMLEARGMEWTEMRYERDPACSICAVDAMPGAAAAVAPAALA
ncbi:MAG: molybdopterin-synthase adenylyltransferase MoeB [Pseudomonadota bacterium]|nr:molybdopterin-synthase adenylyltransferase MoeB [Pseudomonadota bacterium]